MFPEQIETESLELCEFCAENVDVFDLYERFAATNEDIEEVFEFVPQEPYQTVNDAQEQLERAEQQWKDRTAAWYSVQTPSGKLAGYAVLNVNWDRKTGTLGLILGKSFWGNGFATECWHALTELAFDRLQLELVATGHEEGNKKSKRAIEKFIESVGGQYDGVIRNRTPIGDSVLDHHRYTISRREYSQTELAL